MLKLCSNNDTQTNQFIQSIKRKQFPLNYYVKTAEFINVMLSSHLSQ
jgi:hypothetical protein